MSGNHHRPPVFNQNAYNCPHCEAYSNQRWGFVRHNCYDVWRELDDCKISKCAHCSKPAIWLSEKMVYPEIGFAPTPNVDLPTDISRDYQEASEIGIKSPRGAAALLRLAIQKLCKHLGKPGKNINDDIAALVKDGLPIRVQQALDSVRVIGNNAVHPGTIDLQDDAETVKKLFWLVNFVAEKMISEPKQIEDFYTSLPDGNLDQIEKRDDK